MRRIVFAFMALLLIGCAAPLRTGRVVVYGGSSYWVPDRATYDNLIVLLAEVNAGETIISDTDYKHLQNMIGAYEHTLKVNREEHEQECPECQSKIKQ